MEVTFLCYFWTVSSLRSDTPIVFTASWKHMFDTVSADHVLDPDARAKEELSEKGRVLNLGSFYKHLRNLVSCVKYTKVIWKWLFPLSQNQFSGSKTWILLILQGNQCHVETLDIMSESYPFFLCYRAFVCLVGLALLMISGSSENRVQKCLFS